MVASANGLGAALESVSSEQQRLLQLVSVKLQDGIGLCLLKHGTADILCK
jgi:hypothetical protein